MSTKAISIWGGPPGKQELKAQFVDLRTEELSFAKIAERFKVARAALANWNLELEAEIAFLFYRESLAGLLAIWGEQGAEVKNFWDLAE